jgi:hypothetical protein
MSNFICFRPLKRKYQYIKTSIPPRQESLNKEMMKKLKKKFKKVVKYSKKLPKARRIFYHDRNLKTPFFYNTPWKCLKNSSIKFSYDHLNFSHYFYQDCKQYYEVLTKYKNLKDLLQGYDIISYLTESNGIYTGKCKSNLDDRTPISKTDLLFTLKCHPVAEVLLKALFI